MAKQREHWGSNLGFILAAAGSAVGLGNIWKFPYITGENGGGAFVLVYLLCIAVIGLPVMLCEITLGRKTQRNPVGAFKQLSPGSSALAHLLGAGLCFTGVCLLVFQSWGWGVLNLLIGLAVFKWSWKLVGAMGVLSGFVILSYYSVVAGWTIGYTVASGTGRLSTNPTEQKADMLARMLVDEMKGSPEIADPASTAGRREQLLAYFNETFDITLPLQDPALSDRAFAASTATELANRAGKEKILVVLARNHGGGELQKSPEGTTPEVTREFETAVAGALFGQQMDNPRWAIGYHFVFMALCVLIVCLGVRGGIERASKILMPMLFILLVVLIIRGISLPGAAKGVQFFLSPDFSKLTAAGVLEALGHAFFSLSLGMGAMITYGSYVGKEQNLFTSALSITALDTLIALLAGLAIFPAVFAMGFDPSGGPGLVFQVLPTVFSEMRFSLLWATLFFLLLFVAALTSGISLLEVVTAYFVDELKWSRKLAAIVFGTVIFAVGCLVALSITDWDRIVWLKISLAKLFGSVPGNFFDLLDGISFNWMLPLGGFFIAIFVGWVWGTRKALDEIRHGSRNFGDVHVVSLLAGLKDDHSHNSPIHVLTLASIWGFFIRFISPVAVLIAFFHAIGWLDFNPAETAEAPPPPAAVVSGDASRGDTGQ